MHKHVINIIVAQLSAEMNMFTPKSIDNGDYTKYEKIGRKTCFVIFSMLIIAKICTSMLTLKPGKLYMVLISFPWRSCG